LAFHTLGTVGFESTKVLLVRLLGILLLLAWLALEASRIGQTGTTPGPFAWRGALRAIWAGPLRWVLVGALGIALTTILSTAASVAPLVSLLGSWDREQGLVTTLACLVLGVAAALAGRDQDRRRSLLLVWSLGSLPVCLYAAVQFAHLDPVSWLNQPLGVTSTLGSSTALATYLAMLLPITLGWAALAAGPVLPHSLPPARRRGWQARLGDPRVRYGGLVALLTLQLAALVMTRVRGGLLAVAAGLIVTVAFALWPTHRRLVTVGGGLAILALVAGSVAFALLPRPDVGDGADTSFRQRVLIWADAAQAVAGPRLLIGYGPETQVLALEPRYPVELAQRFPDARYDRAHNLVLDTLLTTGLLGLAPLLVTLAGVARAARSAGAGALGPGRWLAGGVLGALVASLAAGQFAFDTSATAALF